METTDKQQILQRLNNMEDVLTDLKEVVKEYFRETAIEKTVENGYGESEYPKDYGYAKGFAPTPPTPPEGYQPLIIDESTVIEKGDMYWDGEWAIMTGEGERYLGRGVKKSELLANFSYCRPIKPATPAVPDGYELLTIDENTVRQETDMGWDESDKKWHPIMNVFLGEKYKDMAPQNLLLFYCRPTQKSLNLEWWRDRKAGESLKELIAFDGWHKKNEDRLYSLQVLEDRIKELNEGWEPDWIGTGQKKYCFCLEGTRLFASVEYVSQTQSNSLCFKSPEIGNQLISEFGEDFIKQALGF